MTSPRILFVSWQGAMGHVTRDLAIVKELHHIAPDVEVAWVAHPLGAKLIRSAGETLLPESELVGDYNLAAVEAVESFGLDLIKYVRRYQQVSQRNARLVDRLLREYEFDLLVGDEIYETLIACAEGSIRLTCPVIMIEDFIGLQPMGRNPLTRLAVFVKNRRLIRAIADTSSTFTHLFVGEIDDVADKRCDYFLPNCREVARRYYRFLGHIVRFDPARYSDKAAVRTRLGYGDEPLVICATGGTGVGRELLELCGQACALLQAETPELRMVFVCGELFGMAPPQLPAGAELHSFLPDIFEHYAACDLAVVVGGGTTTIELTALRKPFLFFPLENQFDQQINVSQRIARHQAGERMAFHETTPEGLAQAIRDHIGRTLPTRDIPFDGAHRAARIIKELLIHSSH